MNIIQPVTDDEIRQTIFSMQELQAPNSDGFQAKFFQDNWDIVGAAVCNFVRKAFEEGRVDRSSNETLHCVIPKVEHPERANQFRPIILCNVIIKTITKLMTACLRPFLSDLIGPTQSAFIPGRGCQDNITVAQEIIHSFKKCRGKDGYFIMSVDLEKAYDRVNWDFLSWVLKDIGFPSTWVSLIMSCISDTDFSLLWNGDKLESFAPKRGLRQGNPLSPYLFVLCLDCFSQMIENVVSLKKWVPFKVTRRGPTVSHISFADDMILVGKTTRETIEATMKCLEEFCSISGQKVNTSKSKLYFSQNTKASVKEDICRATLMEATEDLGKYLEVPLQSKRVMKGTFHGLISRVQSKLSQWKANQLSFAGRQVLVQSISSTLATHVIQSVKLAAGVCVKIDKIQCLFLWGGVEENHRPSLVNWETVCQPKDRGGLGIRTARDMNKSLLSKLGWNLLTQNNGLWSKVLKAKYLPHTSFLQAQPRADASYTWKSILWTKEIIEEGTTS